MKQALLHRVTGLRIITQNAGDLRERPIILHGMLHHVARGKANVAAIDPIGYSNCRSRHLIFPLNHQQQFAEAHNHVLLQHLAANLVLLAQTTLGTHHRPYNLDKNTTRMDGLVKQKGHGCRSGHGKKDRGGFLFSTGARATAPLTPTRGAGAGAAAGAGTAAGLTAFYWHM